MNGSSTPNLRVLVVAGDPLARAGLSGLLADEPGFTVVGAVSNGDDLAGAADAYTADVILWDLGAGADANLPLDVQQIDLPVVALLSDDAVVRSVLSAGIRGILARNADPEMITAALAAVHGGLIVIEPELAEPTLVFRDSLPEPDPLTEREEEVLQLLAEGLPNKLIADRLNISENTVKFHVSSVLSKLGAHSRTEAVMHAVRRGILII